MRLAVRWSQELKSTETLKKEDTTFSNLVEHALNEDRLFVWDRATVLARETKWKARKFHEAALRYMGGQQGGCEYEY
jgi:hypothetical protein